MVSFAQLRDANLGVLTDAGKAWSSLARTLQGADTSYRDRVTGTVQGAGWQGEAAGAAMSEMGPLQSKVHIAAGEAGSISGLLEGGVRDLTEAQQRLKAAIRDAVGSHLRVADDGSLTLPQLSAADRRDPESQRYWHELHTRAQNISDRFKEALRLATEADDRLSHALAGLGKGDLATKLAMQLMGFTDHPVNLPPELIEYAREAAKRNGISDRLMLMILWQEQQWYQNYGKGKGPAGSFGRWLDRTAQDWYKHDKSMGVAHMKVATARDVLERHNVKDQQGRPYSSYSDSELAAKLGNDPRFAIDTSARYLSDIKNEPDGWSDKQAFLIYAADTSAVRDANRRYGDSTDARKYDIHARAVNWDRVAPRIDAEWTWEQLSPQDRQRALAQLGDHGNQDTLESPPYAPGRGADLAAPGAGTPNPRQPTPSANPSPRSCGG
jgi:hypothetical protein